MKYIYKASITALMLLGFVFLTQEGQGYTWNEYNINHVLYMFTHANIFHLAANLVCLWAFKKQINIVAWMTAFIVSFLPSFSEYPVVGMSTLLFAHIGTTWAPSRQLGNMCKKVLPIAVLCGLLPGICLAVHVYALFCGYFLQRLYNETYKTISI